MHFTVACLQMFYVSVCLPHFPELPFSQVLRAGCTSIPHLACLFACISISINNEMRGLVSSGSEILKLQANLEARCCLEHTLNGKSNIRARRILQVLRVGFCRTWLENTI